MIIESTLFRSFKVYTLFLLTLFVLMGCGAMHQAQRLYDKGQYFESCEVVVQELDRKGEFPKDAEDITTALNILHVCTLEFEKSWNNTKLLTDYNSKIIEYKKLLEIRKWYENKFYSQKFASFMHSYPVNAVSLKIAEQYYALAENTPLEVTNNYKQRADFYSEGLKYGAYKDIEEKASFYRKEYATRAADDFYNIAVNAEKNAAHQRAAEHFTKACDIYKPYGQYKDCEARAAKNDRIWRTQAAEDAYNNGLAAEKERSYRSAYEFFNKAATVYKPYGSYKDSEFRAVDNDKKWRAELAESEYNQAESLVRTGRKYNYRQAATHFQAAYNHYKAYGDYRGSSSEANKYAELGNILYSISYRSNGSKYHPSFSIEKVITGSLNAPYYRYSASSRDFLIFVEYNYQCSESQKPRQEPRSWQDGEGKTHQYTATIVSHHNVCTIKGTVSTQGAFSYQHPFSVIAESRGDTMSYQGDTPAQNLPNRSGSLQTLSALQKDVERRMESAVQQAVYGIRTRADQL